MSASVKPIDKIMINNNKTYFGALEVIEKILLGSKYLNITNKYFIFVYQFLLWNDHLIKNVEGDYNKG